MGIRQLRIKPRELQEDRRLEGHRREVEVRPIWRGSLHADVHGKGWGTEAVGLLHGCRWGLPSQEAKGIAEIPEDVASQLRRQPGDRDPSTQETRGIFHVPCSDTGFGSSLNIAVLGVACKARLSNEPAFLSCVFCICPLAWVADPRANHFSAAILVKK